MDDTREGLDEVSQKWIDMLGFGEDYEDLKKDGFEIIAIKDPIELRDEEEI